MAPIVHNTVHVNIVVGANASVVYVLAIVVIEHSGKRIRPSHPRSSHIAPPYRRTYVMKRKKATKSLAFKPDQSNCKSEVGITTPSTHESSNIWTTTSPNTINMPGVRRVTVLKESTKKFSARQPPVAIDTIKDVYRYILSRDTRTMAV